MLGLRVFFRAVWFFEDEGTVASKNSRDTTQAEFDR